MIYLEPNIVIVDDNKNEVQGLIDYYQNLGLGCKFFNASFFEGDDMPDSTYSDVNLIFLDLYYSDKFDAEQCSSWVQSLIPEKSFYVLVLWTKDIGKSDDVTRMLAKINRNPFVCLTQSKLDYHDVGSTKYNFEKLFMEIDIELKKIAGLSEIQVWKNSVKKSANEILGNLSKTTDSIKFNDKLKKIILSHGGKSIKESKDSYRKRFILFDALDNILVSNTKKDIEKIGIEQLNINELYNLEDMGEAEIDKELNSWFHFKLEKNIPNNLIYPGIISEFQDNSWKRMYSIHDDHNIIDFLSKQVGENVSISSIALLLSRPCDIAQGKYGKNLKLLSGLKILNPIRKSNPKKEFQKGPKSFDSIKLYDHLYLSEEESDVTLVFDFRYNFSVPEEIFLSDFTNIKIFNKELLSEMQVEYASYSSRLGVTQII